MPIVFWLTSGLKCVSFKKTHYFSSDPCISIMQGDYSKYQNPNNSKTIGRTYSL